METKKKIPEKEALEIIKTACEFCVEMQKGDEDSSTPVFKFIIDIVERTKLDEVK